MKILDFGIAKLVRPEAALPGLTAAATVSPDTQAGAVLGTVGYMSPEQVRGFSVDKRSDIFAFGAIVYEMLSGHRAFKRETAADTMLAILNEDLPDLPARADHPVSSALERIVTRCLEKNASARFQSADDLAFAIEAVSIQSGTVEASARTVTGRKTQHIGWV